jgi:hypothetical protein
MVDEIVFRIHDIALQNLLQLRRFKEVKEGHELDIV